MTRNAKITLFTGLLFFFLALLMVWTRAYYGSLKDFEKGEAFLRAGDTIKAMTYFDRAMRWYTPFNPNIEKAAQRLWEMGMTAEKSGDIQRALMAFRTIRRGCYAANHFYLPGIDWIKKCDDKISSLSGFEEAGIVSPVPLPSPVPHRGWTLVVLVSSLGWVGSVVLFILFGLQDKAHNPISWRRAVPWCICTAVFFTIWIIGMTKA